MPSPPGRQCSRPTQFLRAAALVVCAATLAQCSHQSTDPSTPSGPTTPPLLGPPTPSEPVPPAFGPQTFVGAGDIGACGGSAESTARLLDRIGGTVFTLGDNAYPSGTRENFRDCYDPSWGRHKDRTRPTPGNHDYQSPGAAPYFEYFGPNAGPAGLGYYSFDLPPWHIVSLNSDPSSVGVQEGWLRADLAASSARCTIAYWHHPLFSSGPNGDTPYMRGLFRVLYEANVDVVLNGHDHLYERFAPQDPSGAPDPARGIRQFVVGTGGVPFYQFTTRKPNSEVQVTGPGTAGVLKLTLLPDTYEWEFITIGSGTRDNGTGRCH